MTTNPHQANPRARRSPEVKRFETPHIDWRVLLADLKRNGCPMYRVARHLDVPPSTARVWLRLKYDIGYGRGRALIRLHAFYCGASLTLKRLTEAEHSAYTSPA